MGSKKKIVPDSRRAWMTLCAVIFSLFASGGLQMSFGTILGALVREFGESKSKTAWVGTLATFFSSALSPITIFLAQKHGTHITHFVGGAFLTVGAVATSLVTTINYMYLTYGVLIGISGALVYAPAMSSIPEIFAKHVSIATGIGSAGSMMGLIFFSFVLPELLDGLGWRKTLWCLSAIGPLISVIGFALPRTAIATGSGSQDENVEQMTQDPWWKSIKKKAYILLNISVVLFTLIDFVPLFIVPLCATESGMPVEQTKWFNIVYGVGSLIARLFSGPMTEPLLRRDRCKYLQLFCLFVYSLLSFLASLTIKFEYLMLYMILIGLLNGIMANLFFLVILEVVGLAGYPAACGINLAMCSVSYTTGPPLAGLLYESVNDVKYLLLTVSGVTFLAAVVMAMVPCATPRRTYALHQSDYDFWRVYCHNPNISPRVPRQSKVFTVSESAVECRENFGYQADKQQMKVKTLAESVSRTELLGSNANFA
ncbi:monocarboxylate transporter 4-like [Dendronephthya gigantea]|uniref:monocarboxylate transporter 4-like n=1 Tax=Dendronephthya gigantea TaxID=151771 RepID=UPI00106C7AA5|nr:monocarboxylate transporter 4-like [Dendronephthya gigantea]